MTKQEEKGLFDDLDENKDGMFDNLEDSKNGLFSGQQDDKESQQNNQYVTIIAGLKIGKSAGGMMQGLAAKFKGKKKKDEKEMEEEEEKAAAEENGLTSEDGDEEEEEDEDEEEEEEEDEEDDDDAVAGPAVEGSYDAAEWEHLEVNISNFRSYTWLGGRSIHLTRCQKRKRSCLNIFTGTSGIYLVSFSCVQSTKYQVQTPVLLRYTPQKIDLETKFKPFIPDYIPAVGDIDAFIKVYKVTLS